MASINPLTSGNSERVGLPSDSGVIPSLVGHGVHLLIGDFFITGGFVKVSNTFMATLATMSVDQTPKSLINSNSYATRKTISNGMLDVALLTANASQLKYSLQLGDKNKFYYVLVTLISLSILFQVLVGVIFIYVGYINLDDPDRQKRLNRLNNVSTVLVFIITVINVFIAGFGISSEQVPL